MFLALYYLLIVAGSGLAKSLADPSIDPETQEKNIIKENQWQERIEPTYQTDPLNLERQHAIHAFMEKLLFAMGPNFVNKSYSIPENATAYPTVSSPLNITTEPCPNMYTRCLSEIFLSSCASPGGVDVDLWNQRFNLFFELPHDMLKSDQLLNATLRVYKNSSLPLSPDTQLNLELYVYTQKLTDTYDISYHYDSQKVSNDYIGWVSFDITALIHNMDLTKQHGFRIKVKEEIGVYWIGSQLMIPMNCSEGSQVVAVPFGLTTEQPEQKYPSLTIYTGVVDQYNFYSGPSSDYSMYEREAEVESEKNMVAKDDNKTLTSKREIQKNYQKRTNKKHRNRDRDFERPDEREIYDYEEVATTQQNFEVYNDGIEEKEEIPIEIRNHNNRDGKRRKFSSHHQKPTTNQVRHTSLYDESIRPTKTSSAELWSTSNHHYRPTSEFLVDCKKSCRENSSHSGRKRQRSKRRHRNHRRSEDQKRRPSHSRSGRRLNGRSHHKGSGHHKTHKNHRVIEEGAEKYVS